MFIVLFFRGQPGFILWPATINWGLLFILFKSFRGQGLVYFQFKVPGTLFVDIPKFSGAARVGVRVAVVVAGDRVAGPLEGDFDQQLTLKLSQTLKMDRE